MTPCTKNQPSIFTAERPIFQIHGEGIGGRVLEGESDFIPNVPVFMAAADLLDVFGDRFLMRRGNREMNSCASPSVSGIGCGFHQVLFKSGARMVWIAVEFDQPLGKAGVVQSRGCQEAADYLPEAACRQQIFNCQAFSCEDTCQVIVEGEFLDLLDEALHIPVDRIVFSGSSLFLVCPKVMKRAQRLKHPAGSPGRRDEFQNLSRLRGSGINPAEPFQFSCVKDRNPIPDGTGPIQPRKREPLLEDIDLGLCPLQGQSPVPGLLYIALVEKVCHFNSPIYQIK